MTKKTYFNIILNIRPVFSINIFKTFILGYSIFNKFKIKKIASRGY